MTEEQKNTKWENELYSQPPKIGKRQSKYSYLHDAISNKVWNVPIANLFSNFSLLRSNDVQMK